jgi:hypothetical protein
MFVGTSSQLEIICAIIEPASDALTRNPSTSLLSSAKHPYILAILFATWKLGGVFAPLDHHVRLEI